MMTLTRKDEIEELTMRLQLLRNREEELLAIDNKSVAEFGQLNAVRRAIQVNKFKLRNVRNCQPVLGHSETSHSIQLNNHGTTSNSRKTY